MDRGSDPAIDTPAPLAVRPRRGGWTGSVAVVVLVLLLLALLALTAAGRTIRAPGPVLAVAVTLLPYLYVAAVVAGFTLWSILPDRRSLPLLLAASVLTAGVLYGPTWPARPERAAGAPIVAMTWNVQRLWGQGHPDPRACVREVIAEIDPDVLAVQEISRARLDALAAELEMDCAHVDYFGTGAADRGGLAVCGRRGFTVRGAGQRFTDDSDWRYVLAEVRRGPVVFNVLGVHLHPYWPLTGDVVRASVEELATGHPRPLLDAGQHGSEVVRAQGAQGVALLERVGRLQDPTLVAGDFNSTRDGALHGGLREHLTDTFERGGQGFGATVRALGWIPLRVDYLYATDAFAVTHSRVVDAPCADHRPVVTELVLREVEAGASP